MNEQLEEEILAGEKAPLPPIKAILVGVDGSDQAEKAARWAARLAAAFRSKLILAAVLQPYHVPGVVSAEDFDRELLETVEGMVMDLAHSLQSTGVEIQRVVRIGKPAEVLAELGKDTDVGLIVVGSRTGNPLAHALLGTVADRLIRSIGKTVLIVR